MQIINKRYKYLGKGVYRDTQTGRIISERLEAEKPRAETIGWIDPDKLNQLK